jgi:DNA-binding CsgD family transcriptional regulator
VLIIPILGRSEHSSMADAAAIIFISDPEIRHVSIANVLIEMYGLTPAEAELAQYLSQGHSLEEAAKARHVALNTARSQLKQIFAKTNTNRQGKLLQLVLSGVASIDSLPGIGDSASHPDRSRNVVA